MNRSNIVEKLRTHEAELRHLGVARLFLFGSTARGEDTDASDVDLAIWFDPDARPRGLAYIGKLEELSEKLSLMHDRPVDIVVEPVLGVQLQRAIDEDRVVAF